MERMSEEEFINNVERHITSLKNLDNKALKILVGRLEEENKKKRKEKSELKLWELKIGTKVKIGNMIAEFLGVDGVYCRWKVEGSKNITIMGHANQKVSEYGEIID